MSSILGEVEPVSHSFQKILDDINHFEHMFIFIISIKLYNFQNL